MFKKLFGRKDGIVGWTTCDMVYMGLPGRSEPWRADRGYVFVIVLVPLRNVRNNVIDFKASDVPLTLSTGDIKHPVGLGLCFDEEFRGLSGQHAGTLFSTTELMMEQKAGSCFAFVYALWHDQVPQSMTYQGTRLELGERLDPEEGRGAPGAPERSQMEAKSAAHLRDHVPFAHSDTSHNGFTTYQQSVPGPGIVAVGPYKDNSIVAFRITPDAVANGAMISTQGISATLDDGQTIAALGAALRVQMQDAPPFGWADKANLGVNTKTLQAGGTINFMHEYTGPFSAVSEHDCKIAAVFPGAAQWDKVRKVHIGDYTAGLGDGTLVFDG